MPSGHTVSTAEILAVGSELLVGETRDTNSGDLARMLTELGVEVRQICDLPDELPAIVEAISMARGRVDLIITSGGLGPTPDDLTREAIAAVLGETPSEDPELLRWLEELWTRRGMAFPASNRKQAWLIASAQPLPNPNGTAPGWWIEADDVVITALPGPPRELLPMWTAEVVPRLRALGLGADRTAETLRLTGIGESAVADVLGEELLRSTRPHVATYARLDAVDVRVWATGDAQADARSIVAAGVASVERLLGDHVFGRGEQTWADALGERLKGRELATLEHGTGAQLAALLGDAPWLRFSEHSREPTGAIDLETRCREVRRRAGTPVGLAVAVRPVGDDLAVEVVVDIDDVVTTSSHSAFRGGEIGRRRAATIACAELWRRLGA
jgi:nicotinamide-nucleotide amidase